VQSGREEEIELLLRRWSRAKSGEGQVVLLSGEPGIGKSRLTAALLESVEPHTKFDAVLIWRWNHITIRATGLVAGSELFDFRSNGEIICRCQLLAEARACT
jgi:predicted ATPase